MNQQIKVAVVGVVDPIVEALFELLEQRNFPVKQLYLVTTADDVGKTLQFQGSSVHSHLLDEFDFSQVELVFFTSGNLISENAIEQAVAAGCKVIDNSRYFADEPDVPVVVPEVNPEQIDVASNQRGIIASPCSAAVQILVALIAIHRHAAIKRLDIFSCQAVSEQGKAGIEDLAGQAARLLNAQPIENKCYSKQIAFNILPQVGEMQVDGYSLIEMQLIQDIHKVLDNSEIGVNPSCIQVPVFFGNSMMIHLECWDFICAEDVRLLLNQDTAVEILDEPENDIFATAVTDAASQDRVFVSRIRDNFSTENSINIWLVADNIRRCQALNMLQIAEHI